MINIRTAIFSSVSINIILHRSRSWPRPALRPWHRSLRLWTPRSRLWRASLILGPFDGRLWPRPRVSTAVAASLLFVVWSGTWTAAFGRWVAWRFAFTLATTWLGLARSGYWAASAWLGPGSASWARSRVAAWGGATFGVVRFYGYVACLTLWFNDYKLVGHAL